MTYEQRLHVLSIATGPRMSTDPRELQRILAGNPKAVVIVATCDRFQVAGKPAEVGATYTVDATTAAGLVAIGKAKLA